MAKWARSRKGAYESGITPTLKPISGKPTERVEDKTKLLTQTFFLAIPDADLSDIPDTIYPLQLDFPEIPKHEIQRVICQHHLTRFQERTQSQIASGKRLYACPQLLIHSTRSSTPAYGLATIQRTFNAQSPSYYGKVARIGTAIY